MGGQLSTTPSTSAYQHLHDRLCNSVREPVTLARRVELEEAIEAKIFNMAMEYCERDLLARMYEALPGQSVRAYPTHEDLDVCKALLNWVGSMCEAVRTDTGTIEFPPAELRHMVYRELRDFDRPQIRRLIAVLYDLVELNCHKAETRRIYPEISRVAMPKFIPEVFVKVKQKLENVIVPFLEKATIQIQQESSYLNVSESGTLPGKLISNRDVRKGDDFPNPPIKKAKPITR
jgi:hypothetical protein